ncbi:MAG: 4-hydroxy-3-methylbut-2-enyl diphosphate reductase [Proteobacteria bacterium]|nr:4-hydroxy-3-methylbut-2-enyl diphosphate reductase [Pseudomonadota bacterium]
MKIELARSSGFCMGVRRAVELALEAVHTRPGPIYSYGPLIHNPQAMKLLSDKGLIALDSGIEGLAGIRGGTVIIRAHGIPPGEWRALEAKGLDLIDATCPRVIRVQAIIRRHAGRGYTTVIWGNPTHPEVIGLLGQAEDNGFVIQGPDDVAGLPEAERVILVAQTTQNHQAFDDVIAAVRRRWPEVEVFDTICGATQRRQDEVRRLARAVEAMVVVGGHSSGNTKRLAAAAEAEGVKTVHVETEAELDPDWLAGAETVGVTAGASTPNWMIRRVTREIERLARKGDTSFQSLAHRVLRFLLLSNLYAAFGAGMLCLSGALLQGIKPQPVFFGVAFFYIHAMHILNNFLDKEASTFSEPDRASFLDTYKTGLLGSGVVSALVSLALSLTIGWKALALLTLMSVGGLLYSVPLAPKSWPRFARLRRLKDIPSSKTIMLSGGWALCLSLVPALSAEGLTGWPTLLVGLAIFLLVFIRSGLGDIMEIQGDRIVGRETIPIIIGEQKTQRLLNVAAGLLVVVLVGGWLSGLLTSLALLLLACAAYTAFYLFLFRRRLMMGGTFFEALVDAVFILAGLLSWFWAGVRGG